MDIDMRLIEPRKAWTPSTQVGDVMNDPLNPVLYAALS